MPTHDFQPGDNLAPWARSDLAPRLRALEPRIVLDAAALIAVDLAAEAPEAALDVTPAAADTPAPPPPADLSASPLEQLLVDSAAALPPARVLLLATNVPDFQDLAAAAARDVRVVTFDPATTGAPALLARLDAALADQPLEQLAIAVHGTEPGTLAITDDLVLQPDSSGAPASEAFLAALKQRFTPAARLDLLSCHVAAGEAGHALLARLEATLGVAVAGSDDLTGNPAHGGDWQLESDARSAATWFVAERLDDFDGTLGPTPTITDSGNSAGAVGGQGGVAVDSNLTLTDATGGDGLLNGATVRIEQDTFEPTEDHLDYDASLAGAIGVTANYDPANGELIFSGVASLADYQALLRSVTYENTSLTPDEAPRSVYFQLGDVLTGYTYSPITGHYYQLVPVNTTWSAAKSDAEGVTLGGLQGYLATVTGTAETALLSPLVNSIGGPPFPPKSAWIAGTDATTPNDWFWSSGPEAGQQFHGTDTDGDPVSTYTNWDGGQPATGTGSDYLAMEADGRWHAQATSRGYFIEFGGLSGDGEGGLGTRVTVSVTAPNHAPVLDGGGNFTLSPLAEDAVGNGGMRVGDLIDSAGPGALTDYNNDPEGIALIDLDADHGTWEYSLDGGLTWQATGAVRADQALLLRGNDLIRFQPSTDWNGTLNDALSFRAWDQRNHAAGDIVDTSINGGQTSFSNATADAALTVTPVNDAPTIDPDADFTVPTIAEDTVGGSGVSISELLAEQVHDVDGDRPLGVALTALDTTHGTWQVSYDAGASWQDVSEASPSKALLLAGNDRIRFTPDADYNGQLPAAIGFHAWDGTAGAAGETVDATLATTGGSLSLTATIADLTVRNVNDAPTLAFDPPDQQTTELAAFEQALPRNLFTDIDPGDELTFSATLVGGDPLPSWLAFDGQQLTLAGRPPLGSAGSWQIAIAATDLAGAQATATLTLLVRQEQSDDDPGGADPQLPRPDRPGAGGEPDADQTASDTTNQTEPENDRDPRDPGDTGGDDPPADSGEATEIQEPNEVAAPADAGPNETATDPVDASPDGEPGPATPRDPAVGANDTTVTTSANPSARHESEFELLLDDVDELSIRIRSVIFDTETLMTDESQPEVFRATWDSILGAYADGGEDLAAYLQSAFRAVGEAAFMYRTAAEAETALRTELDRAAAAGLNLDLSDELDLLNGVRAEVTAASAALQAALEAAAEAGAAGRFDQVLEDVVTAALQRLMDANGELFAQSQALFALKRALADARLAGRVDLDPQTLDPLADNARTTARQTVAEMRKSWDRVAEDVFAAFVQRMVADQQAAAPADNLFNNQFPVR